MRLQPAHVDEGQPLVPFLDSYQVNGVTYDIVGYEPSAGSSFPVYLYAGGDQHKVHASVAESFFARVMARRGFIAALIEFPGMRYPQNRTGDAPPANGDAPGRALRELTVACGEANNSIETVARAVYSYGGTDSGAGGGALATLCRRSRADCSSGVAVHGLSLGGLLAHAAPKYAPAISASLVWSAGNFVPGWGSCCGVHDSSCCTEGKGGLHGGDPLHCELDARISRSLPRSRRRLIIGAKDEYYGGNSSEYGAVAQLERGSGYTCGGARVCIKEDGSGYYSPTPRQVGGYRGEDRQLIGMQGHTFYLDLSAITEEDPEAHVLNEKFVDSVEAWGLISSFEWLAHTATNGTSREIITPATLTPGAPNPSAGF